MTRQANILDPIHAELDPRVWDDPASPTPKLKTKHVHWIKKEVYTTLEKGGYTDIERWLSLVFTGSLTTYQYSDESDCDVSLFVDTKVFPDWSRAEMIALMVEKMDGRLLPGTPHPMQDFVVGRGIKPSDLYKPGLRSGYSLDTLKWIVPPERDRAHDVQAEQGGFYAWALQMADKMEMLLRYEPDKALEMWHAIHHKRQRDMTKGKGDFAESNIIYKMLAQRGLFPALTDLSGEYIASDSSARHHGSSGTADRTFQPRLGEHLGHESLKQSRTSSKQDRDDEKQDTQGTCRSHIVHTDLPSPSSVESSSPSSKQPEQRSSSHDFSDTTDDHTLRSLNDDTRSDIPYTQAASHPPSISTQRTDRAASQDDTWSISSSSPIISRFGKQIKFANICPGCGGENTDFLQNDEAQCFDCGERFWPDMSGEPYKGKPHHTLYHIGAPEIEHDGIDASLNPHGWAYLSEKPQPEWRRPGDVVYQVDVRGLPLHHDPAGFEDDYYYEGNIPPERIKRIAKLEDISGEYIARVAEKTEAEEEKDAKDAKSLHEVFELASGDYGDMWVNEDEKKVCISFGDWEPHLSERAQELAEKEYRGYKIDSESEQGNPGERSHYNKETGEIDREKVPGWKAVYQHGRRVAAGPSEWFAPSYMVPEEAKRQIHEWAHTLPWPLGARMNPHHRYHVTGLYSPTGYNDPEHKAWAESKNGMSYPVQTTGLESFSPGAKGHPVVLRVHSPEMQADTEALMDEAEQRGLPVSRFPGGYKGHITLGYSPTPVEAENPNFAFEVGPLRELHNVYDEESRTAATRPPNLRDATGKKRCSTCWAFKDGHCEMFGGYKVEADQVCDDWEHLKHKTGATQARVLYNKFRPDPVHPPGKLNDSPDLPFVYDPDSGIVHLGPAGAYHFQLIDRTPELREQYPEAGTWTQAPFLGNPHHVHGAMEWPSRAVKFLGTNAGPHEEAIREALGAPAPTPEEQHRWEFSAAMNYDAIAHEVWSKAQSGEGATINLHGEAPVTRYGFAPDVSTQTPIPLAHFTPGDVLDFIERWHDRLSEPGKFLGSWVNGPNVVLDVSEGHDDFSTAFERAWNGHQKSMWDNEINDEIPVRGLDYIQPMAGFDYKPER